MPKRKRQSVVNDSTPHGKSANGIKPAVTRRSARLLSRCSPPRTGSNHPTKERDSVQVQLGRAGNIADDSGPRKRRRELSEDSTAYWIQEGIRPPDPPWPDTAMSQDTSAKKRPRSQTPSSQQRAKINEGMKQFSVVQAVSYDIQPSSKALCQRFQEGSSDPLEGSVFTKEQFSRLQQQIAESNEAKISFYITPYFVPFAATLLSLDKLDKDLEYLYEEFGAEWSNVTTMGSTRPKPDYAVGLGQNAFTAGENKRLDDFAEFNNQVCFTPAMFFPFLLVEAKSGEVGISKADCQNTHSASIAVRAILTLYREAYQDPKRVQELFGEILVFSVSHNHDTACLYGHFVEADPQDPEKLRFRRYPIIYTSIAFGITAKGGSEVSQFIKAVYKDFAPAHRKRITAAVAELLKTEQKTGLSFDTSGTAISRTESLEDSQGTNSGFR